MTARFNWNEILFQIRKSFLHELQRFNISYVELCFLNKEFRERNQCDSYCHFSKYSWGLMTIIVIVILSKHTCSPVTDIHDAMQNPKSSKMNKSTLYLFHSIQSIQMYTFYRITTKDDLIWKYCNYIANVGRKWRTP